MSSKVKQTGFVSIIVASMLMIILALITVGFTRLMQREQRQAVDRQLSRQALYAAESGVNDVAAAISAGTAGYTAADSPKTDCDPSALASSNLSGDGTVAVTCALFNNAPGTLEYDVGVDGSKIVELATTSGNNFNSFTITWGNIDAANNSIGSLPSCAAAPATIFEFPATRPAVVPVLRLDLTSVVGGTYDRNSLLQNTDYMYLVPCDGGGVGSHAFDTASRGNPIAVPCSGTGNQPCSIDITGLLPPAPHASNTFFARIKPIYDNSAVSVSATEDTGAGIVPVQFADAQVGIDVTARAGDVVRRLRVSVPFSTSSEVPEAALQAFDGICKRLDVINETPGAVNITDNCSPPLPLPPSCGASNPFNYATYATTLFPIPPYSIPDRAGVNDVVYSPPGPDFENNSFPDYPVGVGLGVQIDTSCTYEVDFTMHCGINLVPPPSNWSNPPTPAQCGGPAGDQPNEIMRVWFYEGSTSTADPYNLQCTGNKLAYFDTTDRTNGNTQPRWQETVGVNTIRNGNVACVELEHICFATGPPTGISCGPEFSSIFLHDFQFRPIP